MSGLLVALLASAAFAAVMITFGGRLLRWIVHRVWPHGAKGHGLVVFAVCGAGLSACITSEIGTHLVFGAFVFGLAFPRDTAIRSAMSRDLAPLTTSVLLPVYFVLPGLTLDLWAGGASSLLHLAVIILLACVGKFIGAGGAALSTGLTWRDSTAIGVLINTRGLMEIVVLNVGLAAAVIDQQLYGLFVVMAIVTTLIAGPALRRLYRNGEVPAQLGERVPERARLRPIGLEVAPASAGERGS